MFIEEFSIIDAKTLSLFINITILEIGMNNYKFFFFTNLTTSVLRDDKNKQ